MNSDAHDAVTDVTALIEVVRKAELNVVETAITAASAVEKIQFTAACKTRKATEWRGRQQGAV